MPKQVAIYAMLHHEVGVLDNALLHGECNTRSYSHQHARARGRILSVRLECE
jgi:hypothetical protein